MPVNLNDWIQFIERVGFPAFITVLLIALLFWVIREFLKELRDNRKANQEHKDSIIKALNALQDVIKHK